MQRSEESRLAFDATVIQLDLAGEETKGFDNLLSLSSDCGGGRRFSIKWQVANSVRAIAN